MEVGRHSPEGSDEDVARGLAKGAVHSMVFFLPLAEAELGLFDDALRRAETAVRRAEAAGHPFAIAIAGVALGFTHLRRGAAGQAIPPLERASGACRAYGVDVQLPWAASSLGVAYALAGRFREGIESAEEAVRLGEQLQLTRYQPLRVTLLANAHLLAGHLEDAYTAAGDALELARRYNEKGPQAWARYLLAASVDPSQAGNVEEARQDYLAALIQADELGMRPLSAHCHLGLGQLHAALGDAPNAREQFNLALALYRELGMENWPEQAKFALKALNASTAT
jgi:tetratricopeptide (TPR) repeat protein